MRLVTISLLFVMLCLAKAYAQPPGEEPHDHEHDHDSEQIIVIGGHDHSDDPTMGGYQDPAAGETSIAGQTDLDAELEGEQPADSGRRRRERIIRPLESYFFDDSIRAMTFFRWTPDFDYNRVRISGIDTASHDFQNDYPFLKKRGDVGAVYLGTLGAAAMPLDFSMRGEQRDFSFARVWDAYFFTPQNVNFYNVKQAFTQLEYFTAGQKKYAETALHAIHAQNITPSTGFAIQYNAPGTNGIYAHQRTRQRNLSTNLYHTGRKYTMHAGYIWNRAELRENGGVEDDWWITDTILELTENIPVRMRDARTWTANNSFYLVQSYGVPLRKLTDADFSISDQTSFYIGTSTLWSRYKKRYTDTKAQSGDFYADWLVDSEATCDSIAEELFSNKLFIQLQPWGRNAAIGLLDAGVGIDLHRYHDADSQRVKMSDYYLYGAVSGSLARYASWGANVKIHPAGDRSGDLEMGGRIALHAYSKGRPITFEGRVNQTLLTPAYWDRHYRSNHFSWDNDFAKEKRTRLDADFSIPHLGLEVSASQSLLMDRVYYDTLAQPMQHDGTVSVTGLRASKLFKLGILRFDPRVLLQWSSDQTVVPLPTISAYAALYIEFNVVRDVLRLQLGLDGRYHTQYYTPGYMPATAQFYNQHETKVGDYPLVDAFVNAKWKRMRILLEFEHVNDDVFGSRRYFSAAHYPMNKRVLKLGISWSFYD